MNPSQNTQSVLFWKLELENSCGSFMGYRQLTRRLRRKCDLKVRRDTVMRALSIIDPEGVERPKKCALKTRRYGTPGPNFLQHVDGWDKRSPFGIFIHGAVDGFSRRILRLEVNSTNKYPNVIAFHYLTTVQELEGVAIGEQKIQSLEVFNSFSMARRGRFWWKGKFSGGQKFWESAYRSLVVQIREGGGGWWMNLFKDLRDTGFYRDDYLQLPRNAWSFVSYL